MDDPPRARDPRDERWEMDRALDLAGTPEEREREERLLGTPPPSAEELLARADAAWPGDANEPRIREMVRTCGGPRYAALAIEYAVLRKGRGVVYALKAAQRWHRDGLSLADCEAEVRSARPRPAALRMQNYNPPLAKVTLTPDEQAKADRALALMNEMLRARGERREELLREIGRVGEPSPTASERPAAGPVAKRSPQPARRPARDGRPEGTPVHGQAVRAREDSNLQPSDSKSAAHFPGPHRSADPDRNSVARPAPGPHARAAPPLREP